jgi:uncharacterized membrane protein
MNWAHVHLMLNHLPLFGAIAATIVLGAAAATRRPSLGRAGLAVLLATALVGAGVYFTGEPAEEVVEDLPGVSESFIETHEETALVATLVLGAGGLLALLGLIALRPGPSPRMVALAFLLSLAPLGAMAYTAYLGGQIRHSEIRPADLRAGPEPAGASEADDEED